MRPDPAHVGIGAESAVDAHTRVVTLLMPAIRLSLRRSGSSCWQSPIFHAVTQVPRNSGFEELRRSGTQRRKSLAGLRRRTMG